MSTIADNVYNLGESDVAAARLSVERLAECFADAHPPLTRDQADIEASRCYFCYDAPCVQACPTSIDIPGFIRAISTGNLSGAGQKILEANILGGACARVCPTEILCEGACVRTAQQQKPVEIGALQRVATDAAMLRARATGKHPFARAVETRRRIAVVGAGPAGLACAHELAKAGHEVDLFDARSKPGGLNEYGIAAYKMADEFAAREVEFVLGIGGIKLIPNQALGRELDLGALRRDYDAVFLGIGQAGVKALAIPGEDLPGVRDAVRFIEDLRQSRDKADVPVGRHVVVIGGGNTAIDAAVQAKRLGAELVSLVYRRGREDMPATSVEQDWALVNGVAFRHWAAPVAIEGGGAVRAIRFARTVLVDGRLSLGDDGFVLAADMVLKAVGQSLEVSDRDALPKVENGRFLVRDETLETSLPGVFAGGDCIAGQDLTVQAVADGKRAAIGINAYLEGKANG
ncbi:NAD(P)-dependent oxidoreductase [Acidocella sp.]|uniref:NAD(P)-dependent oxidoreductase n=1 Tax=Acidocella sp. TaxID=50710 RepID=UPI003CFBCB75